MNIKLLAYTPNPEKHIEYCARICYNTHDKMTEDSHIGFLKGIINRGHLSVIEHSSASILIEGISRAASHQLVRHRHFSPTQESQRYVSLVGQDDIFVIPETIEKDDLALGLFYHAVEVSQEMYGELIKLNIPKEDARFVFPNATQTRLVISGNFRSWLEYLQKRLDTHAQWEIRELAGLILRELNIIAPNIFNLETITSPTRYCTYNEEEILQYLKKDIA